MYWHLLLRFCMPMCFTRIVFMVRYLIIYFYSPNTLNAISNYKETWTLWIFWVYALDFMRVLLTGNIRVLMEWELQHFNALKFNAAVPMATITMATLHEFCIPISEHTVPSAECTWAKPKQMLFFFCNILPAKPQPLQGANGTCRWR